MIQFRPSQLLGGGKHGPTDPIEYYHRPARRAERQPRPRGLTRRLRARMGVVMMHGHFTRLSINPELMAAYLGE